MNKMLKLSIKSRKLVATVLSLYAFLCIFTGFTLLVRADVPTDIVVPTSGFIAVAQYEFNDENNLGKDTLGNHNLATQNLSKDAVIGGVALKNGGVFYATDLGDGVDFSDLIKGSYSLSMRAYLRSVSDGSNYLISTGSYGSNFQVNVAYKGLSVTLGNSQTVKFGTASTDLGGKEMLNDTFSWYRITMIYDESNLTFRMLVSKEGDSAYSFDATANLTSASVFGGHANSFTIGAQSKFGLNVAQQVNSTISDGVNDYTLYPNISELRIYSGVIDSEELAKIDLYDQNNQLAQNSTYKAIAHYEFKYPTSLGKDSLGNFDLSVTDGVSLDQVNGGVTLGGASGVLYAPALYPKKAGSTTDGYVDFSDLIKGSYTLSTRMYLRSVNDGANYLVSTGSYGSNFQMNWSYQGLGMNFGNSQSAKFGTASTDLGGKAMFSTEFAWYRITMIYDESNLTFRMLVSKESDSAYSFDATATLTSPSLFGGHANTFTIGGQSNFGKAIAQHASTVLTATETTIYPSVSDFRIYSGVIDNAELAKISKYDQDNLAMNDSSNAKQKEVTPIVWYEFNDSANLGKDSLGNFDLSVGGKGQIVHDESGYVTFTRANESFLYAPYLFGTTDFSDLLKGGYTVSYTVKADNTIAEGNRYAITTATYCKGFCVIGSNNGYRVVYSTGGDQTHSVRYETGDNSNEWVNITITMDKATKKLAFYVNGLLMDERVVEDYQAFSQSDEYTFAIGGQATGAGTKGNQYFDGSISDVKVYDFALSARNVKDLYESRETENPFTSVATYTTVESVTVDTSDLNLIISKNNPVESVLSSLPTTATVKDSNDNEETCQIEWLGYKDGIIKGYVKGASASNVESLFAEIKLSYVIDFASVTNSQITDIKIDGETYSGDPLAYGKDSVLTFKVNANNGYKVSAVTVNNQKILPNNDGVYTATVNNYSQVSVIVSPNEYVITYVLNNGQSDEEQIYGYGEEVILADYFTKTGYLFDGWYDNAELSGEKVTTIDSLNPLDVTLYAKWVEAPTQNQGDNPTQNQGCKGSLSGIYFALPLCLSAIAVIKRRKGD